MFEATPATGTIALEQRWENLRKLAESSATGLGRNGIPPDLLAPFFTAYALYSVAHSAGVDTDPKWSQAADVQEQSINALRAKYPVTVLGAPKPMNSLVLWLGVGLAGYTLWRWQDSSQQRRYAYR